MQFNVPQFLEIEDKIIGPLTLKQFAYLAAGGAVLFVVFSYVKFWVFLLLAVPIGLFSIGLAFIKINGRPFIYFLSAFIHYTLRPKLFIWRRKR